ncbi:MAG: hypothetical protein ACFB20_11110 [Opitutales bacterium]
MKPFFLCIAGALSLLAVVCAHAVDRPLFPYTNGALRVQLNPYEPMLGYSKVNGATWLDPERVFIGGQVDGNISYHTLFPRFYGWIYQSEGPQGIIIEAGVSGNGRWLMGIQGETPSDVTDICVRADQRMLFTGTVSAGSEVTPHVAPGEGAFVALLSSATPDWGTDGFGNRGFLRPIPWATFFQGNLTPNTVACLTDCSGVVGGKLTGTVTLDSAESFSAESGTDGFVLRVDGDGAVLWTRVLSGEATQEVTAVAARKDGEVAVVGTHSGTMTVGQHSFHLRGQENGFLFGLTPTNDVTWAVGISSNGESLPNSVEVLADGGYLVSGTFSLDLIINGIPIAESQGGRDVFVLRVAADGTVVWAKGFGGAGEETCGGACVLEDGRLMLTGSFQDDVSFDAVALSTDQPASAFLVELRANGDVIDAQTYVNEGRMLPKTIAAKGTSLAVAGDFTGNALERPLLLDGTNDISAYGHTFEVTYADGDDDGFADYTEALFETDALDPASMPEQMPIVEKVYQAIEYTFPARRNYWYNHREFVDAHQPRFPYYPFRVFDEENWSIFPFVTRGAGGVDCVTLIPKTATQGLFNRDESLRIGAGGIPATGLILVGPATGAEGSDLSSYYLPGSGYDILFLPEGTMTRSIYETLSFERANESRRIGGTGGYSGYFDVQEDGAVLYGFTGVSPVFRGARCGELDMVIAFDGPNSGWLYQETLYGNEGIESGHPCYQYEGDRTLVQEGPAEFTERYSFVPFFDPWRDGTSVYFRPLILEAQPQTGVPRREFHLFSDETVALIEGENVVALGSFTWTRTDGRHVRVTIVDEREGVAEPLNLTLDLTMSSLFSGTYNDVASLTPEASLVGGTGLLKLGNFAWP